MGITIAKEHPAPRPTRGTLFLRSFLPWQIVRFIIVNTKMTMMIVKSHGGHIKKSGED